MKLSKENQKNLLFLGIPVLILAIVFLVITVNNQRKNIVTASEPRFETMLPIIEKADNYFLKMKKGEMQITGWLVDGTEEQQAQQIAERAYFKYLLLKEVNGQKIDLDQLEKAEIYQLIGTVYP